jgi:hypothetical protein
VGADVFVDGEKIGQTPCKFHAKTILGFTYDVVVHKEGYKDGHETVAVEWDNSLIFIIISPLIFLTPFLGNATPRVVYEILEPLPPPNLGPNDGGMPPVGPPPLREH